MRSVFLNFSLSLNKENILNFPNTLSQIDVRTDPDCRVAKLLKMYINYIYLIYISIETSHQKFIYHIFFTTHPNQHF